ncbi:hypothetical protein BAU28_19410 [Bacillus paramycoides]|uniref:Uncharacterized protein n=1 Tax=Bacillus paramycoides TaxID=2026194 RepID=A0A1J9U0P7_9BACI|nr:hypothetical protein BAU28_19410 [Bacillus paramycoides]
MIYLTLSYNERGEKEYFEKLNEVFFSRKYKTNPLPLKKVAKLRLFQLKNSKKASNKLCIKWNVFWLKLLKFMQLFLISEILKDYKMN